MKKRIYLDYNATTPLSPEVKKFYFESLEKYANASSLHEDGRIIAKEMDESRKAVASLINVEADDVLFTSGGSESNNTVFNTMFDEGKKRQRDLIVTTQIEHPCVLESAHRLAQLGFKVEFLPVDEYGIVKQKEFDEAMSKKPLFVSVMTANNEIGTIQDIKALCAAAHEAGALFHTDGVQAAGKIPVDAKDWDVDYMTLSAHKLYAPKGIGALYVKKGVPLLPLIRGGHQEKGLRAGTYNSPSIIAFGLAAKLAKENLSQYEKHTRKLRNRLRDGLLQKISNIRINGHATQVLPNTLDVSFAEAEGESILLYLDLAGIDVSTGSACASGSLEPSHVLMATGVDAELAHGSIRFSLGMFTTEEEIDYTIEKTAEVIAKLRAFSLN